MSNIPFALCFFAMRLAILESVLVGAIPIDVGIPVHIKILFRMCLAISVKLLELKLSKCIKASSIEYISILGIIILNESITRCDMSP